MKRFRQLELHRNGRLVIEDDQHKLDEIVPELARMVGFEQLSPYHPENDLMEHVQQVLAEAGTDDPDLWLAVVFHDIGKPVSWQWHRSKEGRRTFYGHDRVSVDVFNELCDRLGLERFPFDLEQVRWLIAQHMRVGQVNRMREAKREELTGHPHFNRLQRLRDADLAGRKPR